MYTITVMYANQVIGELPTSYLLFQCNSTLWSRKWGNVKRNFSSVSQGVYIANMAIFKLA